MGRVCAQSTTLEEKGPWVKVQSRLQEAGEVSSLGRAGLDGPAGPELSQQLVSHGFVTSGSASLSSVA